MRKFGCVITKEINKFVLSHSPFFVNFNKEDIRNLNNLYFLSKEVLVKSQHKKLSNIISLLYGKSNNRIVEDDTQSSYGVFGKYKEKIVMLSNYLYVEAPKVRISYNDEKIIAKLRNFKYKRKNIYIMVFDEEKTENRLLLLDNILNVENLSQISSKMNFAKPTVFKLKGRIAKGYTSPYEEETITYLDDGSIIVENKYEDKKILRQRLLKYFDMCEIIEPESEREEFKKTIDMYIKKYTS